MGSVFLATTGAEALYSDMGHVGKNSIYVSWTIVKISLILNYLGQGAFLLSLMNYQFIDPSDIANPFYDMLIPGFDIVGVLLGAIAAIIASQALISGSFSIVSEAIRLEFLPTLRTFYPSETKGQLYIPIVNNILFFGCIGIVLIFQTSSHMESAYGLAITITLLATSILLFVYLMCVRKLRLLALLYAVIFIPIESMFFVSCLSKFSHGGFVALIIAFVIAAIMIIWYVSGEIEKSEIAHVDIKKYLPRIEKLRKDSELPYYTDNLIYITKTNNRAQVERDIMYSIFDKDFKRAKTY